MTSHARIPGTGVQIGRNAQKPRSANESAARQAMPRSESMRSKYPINVS
jgi:hypothetical protein